MAPRWAACTHPGAGTEDDRLRRNLTRLRRWTRVADVARDTGINRTTLARLYQENIERVELDVIEGLCIYFDVGVGELSEFIPIEGAPPKNKFRQAK